MMRPVVVKEKRVNESQMHVVEDEVRKAKTMDRDIVTHAMKQSFAKLNPKVMIKKSDYVRCGDWIYHYVHFIVSSKSF